MPIDRDDDLETGKTRGGSGISDIMKKALAAGIGAVFMTEESVRNYVSDAKLPRDIRNYIIQNTTQAKEQFFGYLSKELSQIILKSDLPKVLQRFLSDHTIELEAKIRFKSNGVPEVAGSARATPLPTVAPPAATMLPAAATPAIAPPESPLPPATHMPSSTPIGPATSVPNGNGPRTADDLPM